jgi:hypothetical protein
MILTKDNYYSKEADEEYMSVSQYKNFYGSAGKRGCEARALAILDGEWKTEVSTAMLVGSYVDAWFEGTLDEFKAEHPEIMTQKGELRADFKHAEKIIERAKRDRMFMKFMSGEKQTIMTAELFGAKWKIKMDSYKPGEFITDLKVVKDVYEEEFTEELNAPKRLWAKETGYIDWITYWGYDIQGAIYQEIVYQNTGERLPFFIAALDKHDEPGIGVFVLDSATLKAALSFVEMNMTRLLDLKARMEEPDRCECCDYCRHTKVLTEVYHIHPIAHKTNG